MKTIKDLITDHDYYCESGYFVSSQQVNTYNSWNEFESEWGDAIDYLNLIVRFDIEQREGDKLPHVEIIYIMQRKGYMHKVTVNNITDKDADNIHEFFKQKHEYLLSLWAPYGEK